MNPQEIEKKFQCSHPLMIKAEVAAFSLPMTLAITDGALSGRGKAELILAQVTPQYYRCEWDQTAFEMDVFALCWENLWTVRRCDYKHKVQVHWLAELHPTGPKHAYFRGSDVAIKNGSVKVCGGTADVLPSLWSFVVGPNFNDCGQWYCNIVRDAIRAMTAVAEFAITSVAGSAGGFFIESMLSCD